MPNIDGMPKIMNQMNREGAESHELINTLKLYGLFEIEL